MDSNELEEYVDKNAIYILKSLIKIFQYQENIVIENYSIEEDR